MTRIAMGMNVLMICVRVTKCALKTPSISKVKIESKSTNMTARSQGLIPENIGPLEVCRPQAGGLGHAYELIVSEPEACEPKIAEFAPSPITTCCAYGRSAWSAIIDHGSG